MSRTRECRCTCDGFAMVLRVGSFLAHLGTGAAAGWGFVIASQRFADEQTAKALSGDVAKTLQTLNKSFAFFQGIMAAYYWYVCVCVPPSCTACERASGARRFGEPRTRVAYAPPGAAACGRGSHATKHECLTHRADVSSCADCLCSLFAIIGMLSEIRSKWLRGNLLKHLNFLTSYFGRACFMIYIGACWEKWGGGKEGGGGGGSKGDGERHTNSTAAPCPLCQCLRRLDLRVHPVGAGRKSELRQYRAGRT